MGWILRSWRGEERIWKVFWIYGLLLGILLSVINDIAVTSIGEFLDVPFLVFTIIYAIWIIVSAWRSAFNLEWTYWGYIVRILIILGIIFNILRFSAPYLPIKDWIKAMDEFAAAEECEQELLDYTDKGGTDPDAFRKECFERRMREYNELSEDGVDAPAEDANAVPADSGKYKTSCEQIMTEHAQHNGADPQLYIAQNQEYLQQCIQYYQSRDAAGNTN